MTLGSVSDSARREHSRIISKSVAERDLVKLEQICIASAVRGAVRKWVLLVSSVIYL